MAKRACWGIIKAGATPTVVGELRSWDMESSADELDSSVMGTDEARSEVGRKQHSVSLETFWDPADAGQVELALGALVAVEVYPSGEASGDTHYDGEVRVNNLRFRGDVNGLVEYTIAGRYSGALAPGVVP
jgi:hypothetical protein